MRVLAITRAPWRNDNNTGNTMTNFFSNLEDFEFYNLYFRDQLPQNDIAIKSFSISEGQLIKSFYKKSPIGKVVVKQDDSKLNSEDKIYKSAKRFPSIFLSYVREIIWGLGRWENENLINFLEEVRPDVIYMPVFNCYYPHKILQYINKKTNAKIVLFHGDDNYSLRQFSFSPLYWIYRFNLRKWVKKSVKISDLNYAASDIQKTEYEKVFDKPFKVLTKCTNFSETPKFKEEYNRPLQMVFTGNIGVNRWRSLGVIADTLKKINVNGIKIQMKIYTATPITNKMKKALNIEGSSEIVGYVHSSETAKIQNDADVLIHVEAMDLKNKLKVRHSFSTKIVDYFSIGRPILAYGPKEVASINHLIKNNCAIVANNKKQLYLMLSKAITDRSILDNCVINAFECGKKNHNKEVIRKMLMEDFNKL